MSAEQQEEILSPLDEAPPAFLRALCKAIVEAHGRVCIHRDVAPDHVIILATQHKIRVIDFGIRSVKSLVAVLGKVSGLKARAPLATFLSNLYRELISARSRLVNILIRIAAILAPFPELVLLESDFFNYHGDGRPPRPEWVLRMDPVTALEGMRPGPLFA